MGKSYKKVIEIEYLNDLLSGYTDNLVGAILLLTVHVLNSKHSRYYSFSVISYGYLGNYPAIGVNYIDDRYDNDSDIEKIVFEVFDEIIGSYTLNEFIDFSLKNHAQIEELVNKLKSDNERRFLE